MTIKIPVIFEEGVFKPLINVPFKTHQRLTLSIKFKDSEDFTQEEFKKIENLFNGNNSKTCNSAKSSLNFHKKLCRM